MKSIPNNNRLLATLILFALLSLTIVESAFALQRPFIWADAQEKERVLGLIEKYDWAAANFEGMKQAMAPVVSAHRESPAKSLESVPAFPAGIHSHANKLISAHEAGVLYFMTGEEDYAQYAADVLNVYMQEFGVEGVEPIASTDGPVRDYRDVHPYIGLIYDFIHPYLTKPGITVFDKAGQRRIPFDHARAQLMFRNILDLGFDFWIEGSNHTEMEGAALLYCLLCVEDQEQQDAYMDKFVRGSRHMTGAWWMKQVLIDNDGVWPESASYSGASRGVLVLMEVLDRVRPELHIFRDFEKGMNGDIERRFFYYPNNTEAMAFGTANRQRAPEPLPNLLTRAVRRVGNEDVAKRIFGHMQWERETKGYEPRVPHGGFRSVSSIYNNFFCMDDLEGYEAKKIETAAIVLPYAGIVAQQNMHTSDTKEHGMMYYSGGAEYVHAHLTGINLELYGAGYVMGAVGGNHGPRGMDLFRNYYMNYAAHNTVIVNGTSRGGTKGFWGHQFMLYMDRTQMEAMEPKPYTPAISNDFTFSSQALDDMVNDAKQQRIVSIVRTSDTSGYYFDMFRSRSNQEDKFHDYIYHNIGDDLVLRQSGGTKLSLTAAPDRYPSFEVTKQMRWGETTRLFPGWHYFHDMMTSDATASGIHGTFLLDALERYMHVTMPGGIGREYTACKAPPIAQVTAPYAAIQGENAVQKAAAQVLSIRQPGEAWNRPFIVVYEPSANEQPTVQGVENIMDDGKVIGAKVVSKVGDALVTDIIISQDNGNALYDDPASQLYFLGRFAIVRTVERGDETELTLYIGDGRTLSFRGEVLETEDGKAYKTAFAVNPEDLYTIEGTDFALNELLESDAIVVGARFGEGPVSGARVVVNHERLEQLTGKLPPLDTLNISGIQHFAGHGNRKQINNRHWARWYQEDGNTQIFRIHQGDWQFRDPDPDKAIPGRIEAYSSTMVVEPGTWLEWEGTITIIKPHGGTMFQMFHHGGQLWAFHFGMSGDGDISFFRRQPEVPGKERTITIAENMVGKPLSIRIRTNAENYEIYKKQPLADEDWELVTDGSYQRGEGNRVQFRWGWYLGRNPPGRRVGNDAMYFVTGTTIRSVTKE